MKNLLYVLLTVLLFSCNSKEKKITKKMPLLAENKEIRTYLYGSWVGAYRIEERDTTSPATEEAEQINILIKKITESEVIGQKITGSSIRPLKGTMRRTGNTFYFSLKEPGDDKNDGVFTFEIQKDSILTGTWTANDPKREVTKRKYNLLRKEFKYDPNLMLPEEIYLDYTNPKEQKPQEKTDEKTETDTINENEEYEEGGNTLYRVASDAVYEINSSTTKLKESQLKNLKKLDLEILRNTIFARHGFAFKSATVRQFFDFVYWYVPISHNVDNQLTETEKQNIAILKRFEKYATDNYDTFGR